jgi:flagellar protein FlaF
MTKATQAYGKTASQTTNPRELEADLLLQAASQLQSIRDGWESKQSELNAALTNNRKLWSLLVATVTRPENHGSLININRELASGLRGRA